MRTSCLLITLMFATGFIFGQSPKDKMSLTITDQSNLKEIVKEIERKSKYSFIYNESISLKSPVTILAKDQPLDQVLGLIFKNQPITFKFEKSHILLFKSEVSSKDLKKYTISGYIRDDTSGETMIGANIYDEITGSGAISNEYGFYSLTIPQGNAHLRFSYIGYETEWKEVKLVNTSQINIALKANEQLKEVTVYADKAETGITATQMGALNIPLEAMKNAPALLGEPDIMKTIQMMPGVQAGTEGSAGVYVRGGGSDENLILLDGIPLYNVDHLFGFFSVFTPEAIKKVSLFKGSFPARFGGRLSSVIDVRTNDGDMQKYHGSFGIGLLSSKLQLEGPIIKDRTSFNISARRSYLDFVAKPFMDKNDKFGYYFYDINAKLNHRFNDRSRLFVSIYNGKDKMDTQFKDDGDNYRWKDKMDLDWGNFLAAARWNYQLSPKLFSNTTVAYTEYKFNIDTKTHERNPSTKYENDYSSNYRSGIQDLSANIDLDYHPLPDHHIKFGGGYLHHKFKPEVQTGKIKMNVDGVALDTTYTSLSDSRMTAHEANVYAEDNFDIGDKFSANIGFHMSLFNIKGKIYTSFQPRISSRYQLSDDFSLKASYTQMTQYIHLLSSYTITMPSDLWVPSTPSIKPMKADQYSIGGYYTGIKGWEFSVEAYFKNMNNVLEYKDGASFVGSSQKWEEKVEMGKGRSMGLEFMAQKTIGKTTGWISYTLAKSDRKFAEDGINGGKRFPYRYDRRHHLCATLTHKFSEKIDISGSWEFYTGGTTTVAEEQTLIIRPDDSSLGKWTDPNSGYIDHRNNYRMPSSHRLNLGVNFYKKKKRGMGIWNISIYNVYNAMNPTFMYRTTKWTETSDNEGEDKTIFKKVTILPFIPSVSYTYKF
ncbi:MAG: TonB-dependent receptor [Dysgonomonas sp.]|uniref:TonB-dependent receptor domain-containing protein n=1 Tax=Dysgonomonas sp. TaxID=1891233 RepID=UPI0039E3548E